MNQNERVARSIRFRALLEDGEICEVLDDIETVFMDQWKAAQTIEERENCHKTVRIIAMLRQNMHLIAASERDHVQPHVVTAIRRLK